MRHDLYDLVKVVSTDPKDLSRFFYGAIGIIKAIDKDIEGEPLYQLIYVGRTHNVNDRGRIWYYGHELEGI